MICASPWSHLARMSVAAFLISLATSAQAQEQRFKAVSVKTPDGLTISAQDWGNPNGPEILFIHGFSQSARGRPLRLGYSCGRSCGTCRRARSISERDHDGRRA